MQSFVYPHRKKSEDAIFDQLAEREDQHDQSITSGNVEYEMHEQLRHADYKMYKQGLVWWCSFLLEEYGTLQTL